MIDKINLKNFKCFDNVCVETKAINIFTGINSMGKSTVLQSLLVLAQSHKSIKNDRELSLTGNYVDLGVGQDILYEKAEDESIAINLTVDDNEKKYIFKYNDSSDRLKLVIGQDPSVDDLKWADNLVYLSAYRIEPQVQYSITNDNELELKHFGRLGEFAVQYLKTYGGKEVQNKRILIGAEEATSMLQQVIEWMNLVSPGVNLDIQINTYDKKSILKYEYKLGGYKTMTYKATNVGFGVTYVLPVIIALVASKTGDTIIIENPEAHIHPRGQRIMGELIARAGAGGAQIFIETHSDHILNGIRVAVKRGIIDKDNTNICYFYKDEKDAFKNKFLSPKLDDNGRLDVWPEGFFDEWDNALLDLI